MKFHIAKVLQWLTKDDFSFFELFFLLLAVKLGFGLLAFIAVGLAARFVNALIKAVADDTMRVR